MGRRRLVTLLAGVALLVPATALPVTATATDTSTASTGEAVATEDDGAVTVDAGDGGDATLEATGDAEEQTGTVTAEAETSDPTGEIVAAPSVEASVSPDGPEADATAPVTVGEQTNDPADALPDTSDDGEPGPGTDDTDGPGDDRVTASGGAPTAVGDSGSDATPPATARRRSFEAGPAPRDGGNAPALRGGTPGIDDPRVAPARESAPPTQVAAAPGVDGGADHALLRIFAALLVGLTGGVVLAHRRLYARAAAVVPSGRVEVDDRRSDHGR